MSLNLTDLRRLNLARVPSFGHSLSSWSVLEWAGAMAGEAGEAANVAKKIRRLHDGAKWDDLADRLAEELADVVVYADLVAARIDRDLGAAIARKFDAVSDRVGFAPRLGAAPEPGAKPLEWRPSGHIDDDGSQQAIAGPLRVILAKCGPSVLPWHVDFRFNDRHCHVKYCATEAEGKAAAEAYRSRIIDEMRGSAAPSAVVEGGGA